MSNNRSPSTTDRVPRLLRSLSKTQPTQQITDSPEQTHLTVDGRGMPKQKATAITGHFTRLRRRGTTPAQVETATDNDADSPEQSPQTLHEVQIFDDSIATHKNDDLAVAGDTDSGQPPDPIATNTFAKRVQDIFSTIPPFASSIGSGSPRSTSHGPALHGTADDTPHDTPPVRDHTHPFSFLALPNFENSPVERGWKSLSPTLGRLRLPYAKTPSSPGSEPSRDDVLHCIDDNNSVMMYGPLEPDDTSEVEIACSEIVSINGDGEEIRTPQPSYTPLPSESIDEALMGRGPRTPPPSFVPLPMDSIDQVLMGGSREVSSVRWKENESEIVPGATSTPQVPADGNDPAATQPPVKEYRVWVPSPTKISIQTMWWGFRIYLPPPVLDVLNNKQLEAVKRASLITTALQWLVEHLPISLLPPQMHPGVAILRYLVPYVGYMGGFIAWTWSAIRSFDKGYGVVLTATWLLPFILIPGTWEADKVDRDLQSSSSSS